jgi:CHASE2 domain-containing sensor protein
MKKIIWTSVLLFVSLYLFSIFSLLDLDYFDWQMRSRLHAPQASDQIVIVAVDDESIGWLGGWPWPRSLHAQMIGNLKKQGAKLIALDIIFDSPQTMGGQDQVLKNAIQKNNPIVLASLFTQRKAVKYGTIQTHNEPIALLAGVSAGFGFANPVFDDDGVVRRSQLKVIQDQKTFYSFCHFIS